MAKVLKVGDPYEPDTVVGPVITAQHRDRVESYVRAGREEGGEILAGGERPEKPDRGYYVAPTLIAGCRPGMKVVQEEIFGPVIVAVPFDDDDEGIAIANGTDFGLYDYVFSTDTNRVPRQQAHARRQRRHQHDAAQPQRAVRRQQDERRRSRRRRVRPARVQRAPVGRVAGLTVSIVPDGVLAYGIQLPIQSLSTRVSMDWEREGGTIDDMAAVAEACDQSGFLYVAACHHVAIPRAGRGDVDHLVRSGRDARVPRRAHAEHAVDDQRVRRVLPPPRSRRPRRSRRSTLCRTAACCSESAPVTSKASSTRSVSRSASAARSPTRRSTRSSPRGPTSGRRTTGRAGSTPRSARARVRCNSRTRRSGSAARASPRCDASRASATVGSRRRRRPTASPTTSRSSCASATGCGPAPCPRSATTRSSTWVSRRGSCRSSR